MEPNPLGSGKSEKNELSIVLLNSDNNRVVKNDEQNLNLVTAYSKQYSEISELINNLSIELVTNKKTLNDWQNSEILLRKEIEEKNLAKQQLMQSIDKGTRSSNYSDDVVEYATTKYNHYGDNSAFDGLKRQLCLILEEINNMLSRLIKLIDDQQDLEKQINEKQQKINNYQTCLRFGSHNEYFDMRELRTSLTVPEFKVLMLTDLPLEPWHMTQLLEILIKAGQYITHIDFSKCKLDKTHINLIIHLINANKLLALDLSSNSLSDEDFEDIGQALAHNTTLKLINITNNLITEDGLFKFANLVKANSTLAFINVSNNWICMGNSYLQEISKSLRKNFPTRQLDISLNFVALTKSLINNGIFRSSISMTDSCIEPNQEINRAKARVFLLAKKQMSCDHALLLVERMKKMDSFVFFVWSYSSIHKPKKAKFR